MVDMLDYQYYFAVMAAEDRVRQHNAGRVHRLQKPMRPQRRDRTARDQKR